MAGISHHPFRSPGPARLAYLHGRAAGDVRLDVVSGEGEQGRAVAYTGSGRLSALKARLTRERCGGDRWARYVARLDDGQAIVLSEHDAEDLLWRQRYPAPAG